MIIKKFDYTNNSYLIHHGVKGMKWGVRRRSRGKNRSDGQEKTKQRAIKIGAVAATTAIAAIGAYKIHQYVRANKLTKNKVDRRLFKLAKKASRDMDWNFEIPKRERGNKIIEPEPFRRAVLRRIKTDNIDGEKSWDLIMKAQMDSLNTKRRYRYR